MSVEKILKEGKNCYRIAEADQIDLLVDAAIYYKALYHCIVRARRSLFFSGWQFDTRVSLLRGREAEEAAYPVEFLPLLEKIASERPELQIYILAWDHSIVFAPEREWWQGYRFHHLPSQQIHFQFDSIHPSGGSHHQKIVVADGRVGFCGGLDICGDRWDTSQHQRRNPLRANSDGTRYDLFHDVQIAVQGKAAAALEEIFRARWLAATGAALRPTDPDREPSGSPWDLPHTLRLPAMPVSISRTIPAGSCGETAAVREIARFYEDAIASAERFILIENQYFTSRSIFEALVRRVRQAGRPPVDIILILPERAQNWKEQLAVGFEQRRMLQRLETAAQASDSSIGVYTPVKKANEAMPDQSIYVHSKVLIVDDRILSVGSANTTNRSLGLDTECNINIEAESDLQRRSIAETGLTLLSEHLERPVHAVESLLKERGRWVPALDAACREGRSGRLRKFSLLHSESWVDQILPDGICFDPESPLQAENFFEEIFSIYEEGGAGGELPSKEDAPPAGEKGEKQTGAVRRPLKNGTLTRTALLLGLPLVGLLLFFFMQPQKETILFWVDLLAEARSSRWTLPIYLTGMVAAGVIAFPIVFFLILGGVLFGALWGTLWGWTGALLGAAASYYIGRYLGEPLLKRWGGERTERASRWLEKKGLWAVLTLRVVGILPFTVVNLCAGASRIPFSKYLLGTALGMFPGTLVISSSAYAMIEGTVRFPSKKLQLISGLALFLVWAGASALRRWWVRRRERLPEHASPFHP